MTSNNKLKNLKEHISFSCLPPRNGQFKEGLISSEVIMWEARISAKQLHILLDDAKVGVINTIIVKDLSRFGKNYIEVGQYLEVSFT